MNSKDGYADNTSTYAMSRLMYLNKTYEPGPKKKWGASDSSEATQKNRMRAVGKTSNSVGFTSLSHTKGELTKNALRRVRSSGATVPKKVTNRNVFAPPLPPTLLYATPDDQSITITYTQGNTNGSTLINYLYSFNGITFTEFSPPTTATTVTFIGLTNGTSYTIYLKAKTRAGVSGPSESVTATPASSSPPAPSAPTALSGVGGNQSAYILFTQSGTVTNYQYSTDDGVTFLPFSPPQIYSPLLITKQSSNSGLDLLVNGVTYTIKLKAVNSGTLSAESVSTSATPNTNTDILAPYRLTELDASNPLSYSGSGDIWYNVHSLTANKATLINSPVFDSVNKYFTFDGINQVAQFEGSPFTNVSISNAYTLQIWARVNTSSPEFTSGDGLISKQLGLANDYDGYSLTLNTAGGVTLNMNGATVNGIYSSANGVYGDEWSFYTIVVRFGGGSDNPSYAYVNTRRVITAENNETAIPNQTQLEFPRGIKDTGANYCPADVGAFYWYSTALSQEDIIYNYNATKSRYGY